MKAALELNQMHNLTEQYLPKTTTANKHS